MIFYKTDRDSKAFVYAGVICDFTGVVAKYQDELGTGYNLEYGDTDHMYLSSLIETEFAEKYNADLSGFLIGSSYVFKESEDVISTMERMISAAKVEGFEFRRFENLFRWCRIRTADRLLSEGKYTMLELGIDTNIKEE